MLTNISINSLFLAWNQNWLSSLSNIPAICLSFALQGNVSQYAVGWACEEKLPGRIKDKQPAVLFDKDDNQFWFHVFYSAF